MRKILLLLMICLVGSVTADAARPRRASKAPQTRTAGTVKSERQRTEKEIAETRSKLKQTQKQTTRKRRKKFWTK